MKEFKQFSSGKDSFENLSIDTPTQQLSTSLRELELGNVSSFFSRSTGSIEVRQIKASDRIQVRLDAEVSTTSNSPVSKKTVTIKNTGTLRVSFELKSSSGAADAVGRIYINGATTGTLRVTSSTTYVKYTEDFIVSEGDIVDLRIYSDAVGPTAFAKNFRIFYSNVNKSENFNVTLGS